MRWISAGGLLLALVVPGCSPPTISTLDGSWLWEGTLASGGTIITFVGDVPTTLGSDPNARAIGSGGTPEEGEVVLTKIEFDGRNFGMILTFNDAGVGVFSLIFNGGPTSESSMSGTLSVGQDGAVQDVGTFAMTRQ